MPTYFELLDEPKEDSRIKMGGEKVAGQAGGCLVGCGGTGWRCSYPAALF